VGEDGYMLPIASPQRAMEVFRADAPLDEIADHVRRVVSDGTWTPRVDRLPYWDRPMPGILSGTGVLPG